MTNNHWIPLEPPSSVPPPVVVRGMANLAWSDHRSFPETAPYASDSLVRFAPAKPCASPEVAGLLAHSLLRSELKEHQALLLKDFGIHSPLPPPAMVTRFDILSPRITPRCHGRLDARNPGNFSRRRTVGIHRPGSVSPASSGVMSISRCP
jgi:hypothetical protein